MKEKIKFILSLINAFVILVMINSVAKFIEFHLFYKRMENFEAVLYMFLFSFFFRSILIFIYDYQKIDYFKIEWIKEHKDALIKGNSLIKKINRLKRIENFFNKIYYLRWVGKIIFFMTMSLAEPIFMVIYFREGHSKWDGIPNIKILAFFAYSCLLCTVVLYFSFRTISIL